MTMPLVIKRQILNAAEAFAKAEAHGDGLLHPTLFIIS